MTISRRLYLFVALVVVGCALVVRWAFLELPSVEDPEQRQVLTETARAFLQLGALGTLGALVKYAVDQISAARVERSAAVAFKKDMLHRFRQVHQAVRTVPYLMEQESSAAAYHDGMRRLLDARTALTDIGSDLRVSNLPLSRRT